MVRHRVSLQPYVERESVLTYKLSKISWCSIVERRRSLYIKALLSSLIDTYYYDLSLLVQAIAEGGP